MKRHCLIIVWLIIIQVICSPAAIAQQTSLRVPAGQITVKQGIQLIEQQTSYTVAYNHTDLDTNRMIVLREETVSMERLLTLLLEDTGCIYQLKDNHILIRKEEKKNATATITAPPLPDTRSFPNEEKREYTGKVIDSSTHQPLGYATIALLNEVGDFIVAGVTDDKGIFRLITPERPVALRISFIGYKTQEQPLIVAEKDLGTYLLEEDHTQLQEVTVTASGVQYQVDRNSYVVTDVMRSKSADAEELLDQLHGVRVDKVSNTIKVGNETAVLLLVDGMQQSQQYIKNLSPERVARIEVVNEPSGRYLSEGYAAIINFVLKKDYTGYDIVLRNFSIASPFGANGDDWLMNEQPLAGFTYTKNKINLYGTFAFGRSRWNTPTNRVVEYHDIMALESEKTTTDNPNDKYRYHGNYATVGLNYSITDDHILSLQGEQTYGNESTEKLFWMKYVGSTAPNPYDFGEKTVNRTKDHDWIGSLFYKGKINDRWSVYSDFSYNYYYNTIYNEYLSLYLHQGSPSGNEEWSYNLNEYEENKRLTSFNAESNYTFSSQLSMSVGYSNVWRRYHSDSRAGENFLKYNEKRNKFFFYLSLNPNEKWKIKAGTAIEHINVREKETRQKEWSIQPYLQMNYEAGNHFNIHASYVTNNYYPSLYQLSPMTTAIDTFMMQIGNPDLQSAIRHVASVRFTFWNRLTLMPSFRYTPKRISEIYYREGLDFYRSFANIDAKQYGIQVLFDQPIGKYFTFNSMYMYYYGKVKYQQLGNSVNGWLFDADLNYFHPKHNLGISLGYYRGLEKSIMLQGWQHINMDHWILSLNKQWWDNRLSLSVNYILPVSFGVRWNQKKEIQTPDYRETLTQSLRPYENMLLVRLGLRFNSGKVNQTGRKSTIEKETREQRTTPF